MTELINEIVFKYKPKCNEHWNWIMTNRENKPKFRSLHEYVKFNKQIQAISNKYHRIYNWIHRRLFINKCIKLVEYYWRPLNTGYYLTLKNFNSMLNIDPITCFKS